jgi:hypothetical protein
MRPIGWIIALAVGAGLANTPYPPAHDRAGLLPTADPLPVYHPDPGHWLNQLHATLFIADRVPAEVAGALPEELKAAGLTADQFYKVGWYFKKRPGQPADHRVFGGDVRVSPVEDFGGDRGQRLRDLLAKLDAGSAPADPVARLMLQYDLLHAWIRLDKPGADPATLAAVAKAVRTVALPADVLKALPSGLDKLARVGTAGPPERARPYLSAGLIDRTNASPWVEVDRDSTSTLFHAKNALRVSRIYLNAGSREKTLAAIAAGPAAKLDVGTETAFAFEMIGLDPDLKPVPTKVVDEFRVRRLTGPVALTADNPTASKDGWDQWIYFRSRPGNEFRFLPDDTQSLFLEYGTAKHSTYAAQCALCHRATNAGGQTPVGVRTLAKHANPRESTDPARLPAIAVEQLGPIVARLREVAVN